jgi:peptide-methionine (S)-S-oxide reductase
VVRIRFDPEMIDFETLLEVFFVIHDPTTPDRQGNDVGTQYRSVIFCQNAEQERVARSVMARVDAAGEWGAPAVTQITGAEPFFAAEDYHQAYFRLHGHQPYCAMVVAPKLAKFRKRFAKLLKAS